MLRFTHLGLGILLISAFCIEAHAQEDEFLNLSNSFGTISTVAGAHQSTTTNPDGTAINFWTPSSEGALARGTALSNPHMAAEDALGNLYIADKASHSILKITPDGRIHTFAGTHTAGFNGDGPAPATTLQIYSPNGLYVFPDGTVYLLDPGNHRIRRVATDGTMTTVVNDPDPQWYPSGRALWVSPDEQLIYYTNEYAPAFVGGPAQGAVVKKWTPSKGIELVCSKEVGFTNPGNIAVNPVDGKLYVCDRAEDDTSKVATGLFRIDGPNQRTRITGNISEPVAADGQSALHSFIDGVRGIAFLPNGAYFVCGHKDGSIWYVDTAGILHKYIRGAGKKDNYWISDNVHPPLTDLDYIAQPRAVTVGPNGDLIGVSNDSGFVFVVKSIAPQHLPADLRVTQRAIDGLHLAWTGLLGHTYVVERTLGFQPSDWQIVGAVGAAPAGFTQFVDPIPTPLARAFYRLSPPR
ncbi:hypothetical protein ACXR0O_06800 [Verrucomicrobiota bacterium sgz303538]